MADVEDCSPPADPCSGGCCKAALRIRKTILHVVMVTILLSVSLFAYLYLYVKHYPYRHYPQRDIYAVASLVVELVAYAAVGCLYIYNSSGRQEKIISAGYLVLVLSAFLLSSIDITPDGSGPYGINEFFFGANMVAISTYYVWKLSFILPLLANMVAIPLSRKKIMATVLHATIVTMLFAVIIVFYVVPKHRCVNMVPACLVQLVAYNAVGCLYICNSSRQKEKVISAGCLVLLLFVFLLSSLANSNVRIDLIFGANMVAISLYCIWKLLHLLQRDDDVYSIWKLYHLLQQWFDALDGDVLPRQLARQEEAVPSLSNEIRATESETLELEKKLQHPTAAEPISLPLGFLETITRDFCKEQELGSGGYGVVYKGTLRCGSVIAVKKFRDIHLVGDELFQNEASFPLLMGIKHQNLVQLLGFCAESKGQTMVKQPNGKCIMVKQKTRILCFEYVCNQGLDKHLSDESSGLEWNMRYKIIKGICNGLNFLHEHDIVHLDLKPQNILMDATMMPKIADFGLSRLLGEQKSYTITVTSNRAGTMGYMAPEYIDRGIISNKADIFSLGVIIIEILKGCRYDYPDYRYSTKKDFRHFTEKVLNNWRDRFERALKYTALELHTQQVKQCIDIALECVHPDKEKRPNISNIIEILNATEGSCYDQNGEDLLVDH